MDRIQFSEPQPSLFAQMVDKLRNKSEAELKMLYMRFFKKEIQNDGRILQRMPLLRK